MKSVADELDELAEPLVVSNGEVVPHVPFKQLVALVESRERECRAALAQLERRVAALAALLEQARQALDPSGEQEAPEGNDGGAQVVVDQGSVAGQGDPADQQCQADPDQE